MANTSSSGSGKAPSPGVKKPPILSTSWAFTDNEPDTNYDHACSIANFTRKMDMENGEELKSGVFSIRMKDRQTDWFIRIKRRGEDVQGGCLTVPVQGWGVRGAHQRRHHLQYCGHEGGQNMGKEVDSLRFSKFSI